MDVKYLRPGLGFAQSHLVEELGELLAALGKAGRWGLDSVNPELPFLEQETNEAWIRREIADVRSAIDRFEAELDRR